MKKRRLGFHGIYALKDIGTMANLRVGHGDTPLYGPCLKVYKAGGKGGGADIKGDDEWGFCFGVTHILIESYFRNA
jgi:hypothetical protein